LGFSIFDFGFWILDIRNLQSGILEFGICNLEFAIWNLEFGIWNLEFGICNLEFGIWNPDPESGIWRLGPQIPNQPGSNQQL